MMVYMLVKEIILCVFFFTSIGGYASAWRPYFLWCNYIVGWGSGPNAYTRAAPPITEPPS
jgi:hypothetical protein